MTKTERLTSKQSVRRDDTGLVWTVLPNSDGTTTMVAKATRWTPTQRWTMRSGDVDAFLRGDLVDTWNL